jgi:hypothetical protein
MVCVRNGEITKCDDVHPNQDVEHFIAGELHRPDIGERYIVPHKQVDVVEIGLAETVGSIHYAVSDNFQVKSVSEPFVYAGVGCSGIY